MKKTFIAALTVIFASGLLRASWEEWELGGELGLAVGAGMERGRVLSPSLMVTGTRDIDGKLLELGTGIMFGSSEETNYSGLDPYDNSGRPGVIEDQGKDIKTRMLIMPMTANFIYRFREEFYIGAGLGLYNVFFSEEPLGPWRVNPDSVPGETVKYPATIALGFQQMFGMQVFPMSPNWNWFVGMKSFVIFRTRAGTVMGVNIGGKVRYTW